MPVVPTSQVRVVPQAPRVDIGAFTPSVDPTGGLGIFTEAAKLPLMFETLDIQRARNKAEKSTLDLQQKELDFTAKNFDAIQTARRASEQQKLNDEQIQSGLKTRGLEAEVELKEQTVAQGRQAPQDQIDRLRFPGMFVPAAERQQEGTEGVLSGEGAAATEPAGVPAFNTPSDPVTYRGKWSDRAFPRLSQDPQEFAGQEYERRISELVPPGGLTNRQVTELGGEAKKIRADLQPKVASVVQYDTEGIPMRFDAVTVGDKIFSPQSAPMIDVPTLHKTMPSQKVLDEAVAKRLGETDPAAQVTALTNLEKLENALEVWEKVSQPGDKMTWSRISALLPDKAQALFQPDQVLAQNQVRSAIQFSLKEALGGAFTQREGEALMSRAFDLLQKPETNFLLLGQTIQLVSTTIRDRQAQQEYFNRNGTLAGFVAESGLVNADSSIALAKVDSILAQYEEKSAPATGLSPAAGQAVPPALMEESLKRLQEARGSPTPRPTPAPARP